MKPTPEQIAHSNKLLSKVVLLERLLKSATDDFCEDMKRTDARIANLIRNDLYAINRTHTYFYKTIQPLVNNGIYSDFEELEKIIDKYLDL